LGSKHTPANLKADAFSKLDACACGICAIAINHFAANVLIGKSGGREGQKEDGKARHGASIASSRRLTKRAEYRTSEPWFLQSV
jgi:hypothetical protein